jgi:hypothetical protein
VAVLGAIAGSPPRVRVKADDLDEILEASESIAIPGVVLEAPSGG